jgi:hypothetical protein
MGRVSKGINEEDGELVGCWAYLNDEWLGVTRKGEILSRRGYCEGVSC